jgi:hypothetical protein
MEQPEIPSSSKRRSKVWALIAVFLTVGMLIGIGIGAALFYYPTQTANVFVTMQPYNPNSTISTIHYVIGSNGVYYTDGSFLNGTTRVVLIIVAFPYFPTSTYKVVQVEFGEEGHQSQNYSQAVEVTSGGNYEISFYYYY